MKTPRVLLSFDRFRRREEGIVMVTVLLVSFVLLILVTGTLGYALGSQPLSRRDQDWSAALTAAQAGIDDYLFRLNQNDQYYLYGTAAPSAQCGTQPSLATSPDSNPAFTGWVSVPGATNGATFRYSVDTSCLSQGAIVLWSTGKSQNVTRTVQVTIRRRAFIDYLYFTDYETTDPAAYPVSGTNDSDTTWAQTNCAQHWYEGRPGGPPYDDSHCVDLNFVSGDSINGPLHSNDAILTCGTPNFASTVTTSWTGTGSPVKRYRQNSGCSGNPTFASSGDPKYADPLTMPPSNLAIKVKADAGLGGTGCLLTGPSSITLNSNGTMTVVSPGSLSNSSTGSVSTSSCVGTNVPLPSDGVIFVQDVPASSTDPNYTAACRTSSQLGYSSGAPTVNHPLGYPQRYDITTYGCQDGDAFVKGTLSGRLTIAADNNIDIIGSLTYAGGTGGNDLLGLVANNYVEIYHPVGDCGSSSSPCDNGSKVNGYYNLDDVAGGLTTPLANPTINAALLSVNHSFRVQNYQYGDDGTMGTINLYGAGAQRYRGPVGTAGSTGYLKSYNYDTRMKYQSPPFFLNPLDSAWQIVTWTECKGTSNGTVPTSCQ